MSQSDQQARYESLIRLSEAIRSCRKYDLFETIERELHQFIPFHTMGHYDAINRRMNWRVDGSVPEDDPIRGLPTEGTVVWWSFTHQETVVIQSVGLETRFPQAMSRLRQIGVQSLCALPLTTAHRRLGGIVFASDTEGVFPPEEVRFLNLVATQIALAIDDTLNFREAQRTAERLELLLDLTNRVVATLDLRDLLREVASAIRRVMHCEGVSIALPDPETSLLRVYAIDFPTSKGFIQEGVTFDESTVIAEVFRSGRPVNLTSEQIAAQPLSSLEAAQSLFHFPIVGRRRTLGVATLGSARPEAFSDDDIAFLSRVSAQIAIAIENAFAYDKIAALKEKLTQEKIYLEDEIRSELNFEEIIGTSPGLRRVLTQVETVAPTESTVIVYGETGTGKELIARAVHDLSARKSGAFVKLNCAAIPTGLLESELFGHERGAFTGAIAQRIGRFELANKGTIFLDEIGEIPLEVQPKLLRVLQEREFERLGSSRTLRTDARLIAATNRDLEAMVAENKFRSDLFYRLNVFPIRIPPLRERTEDIPLLVRHFVQQFARRNGRTIDSIPSATMETLTRYHWPGNIRELQNVIERAVIVSKGPVLQVPLAELKSTSAPQPRSAPTENLRDALSEAERTRVLKALDESNWKVAGPTGAAARLGMKRSTLQFRMRKLGVARQA